MSDTRRFDLKPLPVARPMKMSRGNPHLEPQPAGATPAPELEEESTLYMDWIVWVRPILLAMFQASGTMLGDWVLEDEVKKVAETMGLQDAEKCNEEIEWMRKNQAIKIGIADRKTIAKAWVDVMGDIPGMPVLRDESAVAILYKFSVLLKWTALGVQAKRKNKQVLARGGSARTQPIEIVIGDECANFIPGDEGRPHVFSFEEQRGDRRLILTGIPKSKGSEGFDTALEYARRIHDSVDEAATKKQFRPLPEGQKIELLPVRAAGHPDTATKKFGLGALLGAECPRKNVFIDEVMANFEMTVDEKGVSADAHAYVILLTRGIDWGADGIKMHDDEGNQTLLVTLYKAGRKEWGMAVGNGAHLVA